ncbi:hypothetical protein D9619_003682 [Psilocybe cf. subviscida]|uniref:Uncharacterized protein n=1 Tax=Psilocybe cf. subviscida TaxID=2480587 RepID=A0A8H5AXX6_9AGAR|nr:hypothetical protein D9619_003682 [Psilocybe cf. subviscida]
MVLKMNRQWTTELESKYKRCKKRETFDKRCTSFNYHNGTSYGEQTACSSTNEQGQGYSGRNTSHTRVSAGTDDSARIRARAVRRTKALNAGTSSGGTGTSIKYRHKQQSKYVQRE